jgi:hypothetical protein
MKLVAPLLLTLLVGCGQAPSPKIVYIEVVKEIPAVQIEEGCQIKTSSELTNRRHVSNILNLKKDIDPNGRCTVNFDLIVDGKTYHLEETEIGWEQTGSLCYYARERARKNLLLDLGGDFTSESNVTCKHTNG